MLAHPRRLAIYVCRFLTFTAKNPSACKRRSSVERVGEPAFEDLTGRARIRDVALRLFGDRGLDATTIRDIAAAAGVSGGLVRHHFGSKEGFRDSCDAYALDQLTRLKERAVVDGQMATPGFLAGAPDSAQNSHLTPKRNSTCARRGGRAAEFSIARSGSARVWRRYRRERFDLLGECCQS